MVWMDCTTCILYSCVAIHSGGVTMKPKVRKGRKAKYSQVHRDRTKYTRKQKQKKGTKNEHV